MSRDDIFVFASPIKRGSVSYRRHYALVNKKTGKIASISTDENVLAAITLINNDTSGIASLIETKKIKDLLIHNKLSEKNMRGYEKNWLFEKALSPRQKLASVKARAQAQELITPFAVIWAAKLPRFRPPRRKDFARWVVEELKNRSSKASQYAEKLGYHDLIDAKPNERWWLNRLEKMQS